MKKRCLPTYLILRNIVLILVGVASSVVVTAELHVSANQQQEETAALRRLFVYQILISVGQQTQ
ncbi:hypothetical protein [Leptolyngbya sp. KIOST-1]|uniref:hypothetical protein n=1 Tax=Leptolyngbya sp. KIOST-1 TaxID=1229172 RepID=UPI00056C87F1|nr:hypothetical protein [Leptolyngbya sp. KIOST-1]